MKFLRLFFLSSFFLLPYIYAEENTAALEEKLIQLEAEVDELAAPASSPQVQEILNLWHSGQASKAHRSVQKWIKSEEENPEPRVVLAQLKFLEKKYKKCISICKKTLKKFPQNADSFYWRAKSYEALGDYLEAANEYRAAIKSRKNFPDARQGLQKVLARLRGE